MVLRKFVIVDLRLFQNKNVEVIIFLKDILINYKGEVIEDEVLFKMGMIYEEFN